jgi:dTDP-4-dehydrorhamnose 3,5-epimerase-like enzyme
MKPNEITTEWLQAQKFNIQKGITINGVFMKELKPLIDDRGDVIELWSTAWPEFKDGTVLNTTHVYQSATDPGSVKCWHLHDEHTDQFTVTRGKLQVCMVDLRPGSPTFLDANTVLMGMGIPRFLKIPNGIMHGWKALGQVESIVVNCQTHPYDSKDEFKFPWDCVLLEMWGPKNG